MMTNTLSSRHNALLATCRHQLSEMSLQWQQIDESKPDEAMVSSSLLVMAEIKQIAMEVASVELEQLASSMSALLLEISEAHYVQHDVKTAILTAIDTMMTLSAAVEDEVIMDDMVTADHDVALRPCLWFENPTVDKIWQIEIAPEATLLQQGEPLIELFQQLSSLGELRVDVDLTSLPPFFDYDPASCYLSWTLHLTGTISRGELIEILSPLRDHGHYQITALSSQPLEVIHHRDDEVETDADNVAAIQGLLTDLMAVHTTFYIDQKHLSPSARLDDGLQQCRDIIQAMQMMLGRMRVASTRQLFRVMMDEIDRVKQEVKSPIDGLLLGADVQLDAAQLNMLTPVITKLTRYMLTEQIETIDQRRLAGKPDNATITLKVSYQQNHLNIEITNDGAGLAIEDQEDSVFHIIQADLMSLGGTIQVKAQEAEGSSFVITLPNVDSFIDGQFVDIAGYQYVLPAADIVEAMTYDQGQCETIAQLGEVYQYEGQYLPLIRLNQLLHDSDRADADVVLVVEVQHERIAMLVTDVIKQQQVMVKPLETHYQTVTGIAGATVLDDGHVILALDLAGVTALYRQAQSKDGVS